MSTPPTDIPGPLFDAVIEALVAGPASLDQVVQAVTPGDPADPEQDPAWKVSSLITQCVQVALPIVLASRDSETAELRRKLALAEDCLRAMEEAKDQIVMALGWPAHQTEPELSDVLTVIADLRAASLRGEQ